MSASPRIPWLRCNAWSFRCVADATLRGAKPEYRTQGKLFLPPQLHHRVLPGHLAVGVAGDLAGFDAAPPTSCRQVMLARRSVCRPRPAKSYPSSAAACPSALRTPESHIGRFPSC